MTKKQFNQLRSKIRKIKRDCYVPFNKSESIKRYSAGRNECYDLALSAGCVIAYHSVWNTHRRPLPVISVVEGFRDYPDCKHYRLYNNLGSV